MPKRFEQKRFEQRLLRADKVAREVRHLISEDGGINATNSQNLMILIDSWMNLAGKSTYERPVVSRTRWTR